MAVGNKLLVTCLRWILFILLQMSVSILLVCNRHYQNFSTKMSHCVLFWRLWVDFFFSCYLGTCKYILVWRLMLKFEKSMKFFMLWRNKNGKRSVLGFVWESSLNLDCDILVHVYLGLGSNPGSTSSVLSRALMLYHCPGWDLYFHQLHHSSSSVGGTLTCVNLFANAMMCVAAVKSCGSVQCL